MSQTKSESKSKFKEADGADERMLSKEDTMLSSNSDIPLKDVKIVMSEKNGEAKVDGGKFYFNYEYNKTILTFTLLKVVCNMSYST